MKLLCAASEVCALGCADRPDNCRARLGFHRPARLLDVLHPPDRLQDASLLNIILVFGRNNDRNVQRFVNGRFGDRVRICVSK